MPLKRIQKNSVKGFLIYFTIAVVKSNCFLIRVVSKLQWNLHLTNLYRGGSRIFFRRGCNRLLSTSTPINHIVLFFFGRIPVVLENRGSGRGGAHPLHPPPRSAPALYNEVLGITIDFLQPDQNYSKMYGT